MLATAKSRPDWGFLRRTVASSAPLFGRRLTMFGKE